jgi:hypothetical protein
LVRACIGRVAVEDFPDAVYARGLVVAWPEVFLDVFDGVDAEAVDWCC